MYFVFVILASEPGEDYAIMTAIIIRDQVVTFPHYTDIFLAGVYDTELEAQEGDRYLRRRLKEQMDTQGKIQLDEIEGMYFVWRKDLVSIDQDKAPSYYEATPSNIQHSFVPGEKLCVLLATPHEDEVHELIDELIADGAGTDPDSSANRLTWLAVGDT